MQNYFKYAAIAAIGVIVLWTIGSYNGLVTLDESSNTAWGKVQSAYQRRADLIGNLVETVKGYANFEKSTLTEVIEARAKATSITIDPSKATPEQLQQFNDAQGGLNSALSRLLVSVEAYPNLKADQQFLSLQAELAGTENRIKFERDQFTDTVQRYNRKVRSFPVVMVAGMLGFEKRAYFAADAGADKAPQVKF
jgi:LemA protein